MHVTVLHRLETDGKSSTEDEPHVITEIFYVTSPDQRHDQHKVQGLMSQ